MKLLYSCSEATDFCMQTQRFAVSHLLSGEKTKKAHIHECYEIYYSITGGKEFSINDGCHEINTHDVFFIAPKENHRISRIENGAHERINIAIHRNFFARYSTPDSPLENCFKNVADPFNRTVHLDRGARQRFEYLVHKIGRTEGFGADIQEDLSLCEILVLLNTLQQRKCVLDSTVSANHATAKGMMDYINQHFTEKISLEQLSREFYISESYACRVFRAFAGVTVSKYIAARRIGLAKALLEEGARPSEIYTKVGFNSYNHFFKTFVDIVGVSPASYSKYD